MASVWTDDERKELKFDLRCHWGSHPNIGAWTPEQFEELASRVEAVNLSPGEYLMKENELVTPYFYTIIRGAVWMIRDGYQDKTKISRGLFFGMDLLERAEDEMEPDQTDYSDCQIEAPYHVLAVENEAATVLGRLSISTLRDVLFRNALGASSKSKSKKMSKKKVKPLKLAAGHLDDPHPGRKKTKKKEHVSTYVSSEEEVEKKKFLDKLLPTAGESPNPRTVKRKKKPNTEMDGHASLSSMSLDLTSDSHQNFGESAPAIGTNYTPDELLHLDSGGEGSDHEVEKVQETPPPPPPELMLSPKKDFLKRPQPEPVKEEEEEEPPPPVVVEEPPAPVVVEEPPLPPPAPVKPVEKPVPSKSTASKKPVKVVKKDSDGGAIRKSITKKEPEPKERTKSIRPKRENAQQNVYQKPLDVKKTYKARVVKKSELEKEVISQALAKVVPLHKFGKGNVIKIINAFERQKVEEGADLESLDGVDPCFYVVNDGAISVQMQGQEIREVKNGESVGGENLYYSKKNPAMSFVAKTQSELFRVDQTTFRSILQAETKKEEEKKQKLLEKLLETNGLFENMSETNRKKLVWSMKLITFSKGEMIVKKADYGNSFYVVDEGSVICVDPDSPAKVVERHLDCGGYFGETKMVTGGVKAYDVTGATDGTAYVIDMTTFEKVLGKVRNVILTRMQVQSLQKIPELQYHKFKPLALEELRRLVQLTEDRFFKKGSTILEADVTVPAAFYFVREGKAKKLTGRFNQLYFANNHFGEDLFEMARKNKSLTGITKSRVIAAEDCTCGVLTIEDYLTVFANKKEEPKSNKKKKPVVVESDSSESTEEDVQKFQKERDSDVSSSDSSDDEIPAPPKKEPEKKITATPKKEPEKKIPLAALKEPEKEISAPPKEPEKVIPAPSEEEVPQQAKREKEDEARREEDMREEDMREEARREEARREEARKEEARKEEARKEEARKEEARREEARREEARREEARKEEARKEETRKEEARKEKERKEKERKEKERKEKEKKEKERKEKEAMKKKAVELAKKKPPTHVYKLENIVKKVMLGEGQFGQVWLVTDSTEKEPKPYAFKIQSKFELVEQGAAPMCINEQKVMSALDHPMIIKLFATFQDKTFIYMMLDMVSGGELFSLIHPTVDVSDRDGIPENNARFYAFIIADVLAYIHERKYVYRDMKPENVLIDRCGYPVLIDFGFAKKITSKTFTLCGTPAYVPPEMILQNGHTYSADHWAYGVLIYEMLCGDSPFFQDGIEPTELYRSIVEDDYEPPSEGSPLVHDLIDQLLVKDEIHRLGSLAGGERDITDHPWFSGLDLGKVRERALEPPWIPEVADPFDVRHFDDWGDVEDKTLAQFPPLRAKDAEIFDLLS